LTLRGPSQAAQATWNDIDCHSEVSSFVSRRFVKSNRGSNHAALEVVTVVLYFARRKI